MATFEGSLSKWTNVMKGWQYRWFVLDEHAGLLSYYTSREKMMRGVRRGCVRLKGAIIGIDDEDDSTFTITVDSKTFHFQARDAEEREKWVRCLEDAIMKCMNCSFGYKIPNSLRLDSVKSSTTMADFDKKLTEADAFLQIIIDQTKALDLKIKTMHESEEKVRCEEILSHANDMLEQVKHTIVLLQIAKNTAHPVNGTYQPISPDTSAKSIDGLQHRPNLSIPLAVPDTSYSSSEEEDFYDAHDDSGTPTLSPRSSNDDDGFEPESAEADGSPAEKSPEPFASGSSGSPSTSKFIKPNGFFDYDAMYEDTTESDISMETQGSVVTHLLSQVKIGMDLTKVVLPTFILERRSLLEMYADYFAHPDMFLRIAELDSEQDRMVQVIKWYLCSYHAGRKSSVAKKPYNPILGEIFQCYWDVEAPVDDELVPDGPIPWCRRDQLTFVAEQVSHHPPISAFYAEHVNKRISFNAHVWTKSKFLGLSIGVHNVGFGTVHLMDSDEDYVVTFPNGYGRSILTVPWIELGGTVRIFCEKTGYTATIEFITKPFYGGKKHRICAEVFSPHEKKPFLTINGEWNGVMEAKWTDGRTELFADVDKLLITKKTVRPVDQQSENESRRLWKEVTAGLRLNDVSYATKAKSEIEQKQRFEAQQRKQMGVTWETKLFHPIGSDKWQFNKPLGDRSNTSLNR